MMTHLIVTVGSLVDAALVDVAVAEIIMVDPWVDAAVAEVAGTITSKLYLDKQSLR